MEIDDECVYSKNECEIAKLKNKNSLLESEIEILKHKLSLAETELTLAKLDSLNSENIGDNSNRVLDSVNILNLNENVFLEILSYLSVNELMTLRCVCKRMKSIADTALVGRRGHISIKGRYADLSQPLFLLSYFRKLKRISVYSSNIDFLQLLDLSDNKFRNLESLEIDNADNYDNVHLKSITDYFAQLKCLTLSNIPITDECISHLFRSLPTLQQISLNFLDLTGECFQHIGNNITSLEWRTWKMTDERDDKPLLELDPLLNSDCLKKLTTFAFSAATIEQCRSVIEVITEKMGNLKSLELEMDHFLDALSSLSTLKLEKLSLFIFEGENWFFSNSMPTVKTLNVHSYIIDDLDLIALMLKFPNVENLSIAYNTTLTVTDNFIDGLLMPQNLKSFSLTCSAPEDCHPDSIDVRKLIELFSSLTNVVRFDLSFDRLSKEFSGKELLSTIEQLAFQKPNQKFNVVFRLPEICDKTFPQNVSLKYVYEY
ncbi:hypothetical protein B4U80_13448 [Leptotrombidium deliense]|uniref:F-box domain-containing protein n=1 Tax=Leptotrombidium deliense TaxID=299467 RepID=A0A443S639_9ACAR|nr:hypothetical protein B4U80_13448 [Leptotrombidium deliense]